MHCSITEHVGVRSVLCRFLTCDLEILGEAEVAWKSTRLFQTTNVNARKPGTILCLCAVLVLQSRPQAHLVVKFSNEFRSVSESKNQPQQTPSNPWKNTKIVCCLLRLSMLFTGNSVHTGRLNACLFFISRCRWVYRWPENTDTLVLSSDLFPCSCAEP